MSYSHYLTYPFHRDPNTFGLFIHDVGSIVESAPEGADLCGTGHEGPPVINNDMLIIGSKANPSPFSILRISANEPWPAHRYPLITIQTDKHIYDSVICACLLAFHHHFPASTITTNGTAKDWKMGLSLYEYAAQRLAPTIDFQNV